jgi:hypothetical protein
VDNFPLSDRCNGRKSSNDAGSHAVLLATMNAQQAVAKRSVGRRVTHLDAPFFWFGFGPGALRLHIAARCDPLPKRLRRIRYSAACVNS